MTTSTEREEACVCVLAHMFACIRMCVCVCVYKEEKREMYTAEFYYFLGPFFMLFFNNKFVKSI